MQIVINIPKGRYEDILSGKEFTLYQCDVREVLKNGTPLPKGHGRLGDLDALGEKLHKYTEAPYQYALMVFDESPTIIEADKGDGEQNRCGNCKEFGTVSCAETYREPIENDKACECYKGE